MSTEYLCSNVRMVELYAIICWLSSSDVGSAGDNFKQQSTLVIKQQQATTARTHILQIFKQQQSPNVIKQQRALQPGFWLLGCGRRLASCKCS